MSNIYHDPAEPLLPGEQPNIEIALRDAFDDKWLHESNAYFGGLTPYEMIGTADEYILRNFLRTLVYAGIS